MASYRPAGTDYGLIRTQSVVFAVARQSGTDFALGASMARSGRVPKWPEKQGSSTSSEGRNGSPRGPSSSGDQWEGELVRGVILKESRRQWPTLSRIVAVPLSG
jgi:hypothetical protein